MAKDVFTEFEQLEISEIKGLLTELCDVSREIKFRFSTDETRKYIHKARTILNRIELKNNKLMESENKDDAFKD